MATQDRCVSIHPYFKVSDENMEKFRGYIEQFVAKASAEPGCLYYGFSFNADVAHCRECYDDADAALAHIQNVGALITEALGISELVRFEIHGVEQELAKLREPLADLNATYFTLEYGMRR